MKRVIILIVIAVLTAPTLVGATSVTVAWDINDDADYYVTYHTKNKERFTLTLEEWDLYVSSQDVNDIYEMHVSPNITDLTYTLEDIPYSMYYIAVKAFNTCGNSSDYSDYIVYLPIPRNFRVSVEGFFTTNNVATLLAALVGAASLVGAGVVASNKETST